MSGGMSQMNKIDRILVSISQQRMQLYCSGTLIKHYPVSTAKNGPGERINSECTPRGMHRIRLVIGRGCPENAVFIGRRHTGECYSDELGEAEPERDWILSRIIWLTGTESGINRGGVCDTLRRYIYIHGTPDSEPMGIPESHGCIRMRNRDVIELADLADTGIPVLIEE